jgi:hypothetical protein
MGESFDRESLERSISRTALVPSKNREKKEQNKEKNPSCGRDSFFSLLFIIAGVCQRPAAWLCGRGGFGQGLVQLKLSIARPFCLLGKMGNRLSGSPTKGS